MLGFDDAARLRQRTSVKSEQPNSARRTLCVHAPDTCVSEQRTKRGRAASNCRRIQIRFDLRCCTGSMHFGRKMCTRCSRVAPARDAWKQDDVPRARAVSKGGGWPTRALRAGTRACPCSVSKRMKRRLPLATSGSVLERPTPTITHLPRPGSEPFHLLRKPHPVDSSVWPRRRVVRNGHARVSPTPRQSSVVQSNSHARGPRLSATTTPRRATRTRAVSEVADRGAETAETTVSSRR
jgi:hypothetical protein